MHSQVRAVQADYDRRSPFWQHLYDGDPRTLHDHVLQDRMRLAVAFAREHGPGEGPSLDVGCGAGQLVQASAALGHMAYGVDVSAAQARLAAGRAPGRVAQADGTALPFPDGAFSLVTGLGYLEYLPEPEAGAAELARVAAPGGLVVVSMPNVLRLPYLLDPVGVARGRRNPQHRGYPRRYATLRRLRELLRAAGVEPVTGVGHGLGPFTAGGRPLLSEQRATALDKHAPRWLSALGADLVIAGRRLPAPSGPAAAASRAAAAARPPSPAAATAEPPR